MSEWIACTDKLPPLNKYVLGYYCGGNWIDSRDDPNREVVMRIRWQRHTKAPWEWMWITFGPMRHGAGDISHWKPLPEPPLDASHE